MPTGIYDRSPEEAERIREMARQLGLGRRGRKRTKESREKQSLHRRGKMTGNKNPSWRGGITKVVELVRKHPEYLRWRLSVMERDNYTCQLCGRRGGNLHVHHSPKTFAKILIENDIQSTEQAL